MRVIRLLVVCALAVACQRDAPVAPERRADPAKEQLAALSAEDRAALAAAITDAQAWLLPSLSERDVATNAIAGRFADLATTLARPETGALAAHISAARQALEASAVEPPGDRFIELAALGLVLDGVEAVLQGRLRLVPFDAAAPDLRPDALRTANEPKRATLERSVP